MAVNYYPSLWYNPSQMPASQFPFLASSSTFFGIETKAGTVTVLRFRTAYVEVSTMFQALGDMTMANRVTPYQPRPCPPYKTP
jgi:hypothetical protein